MTTMIELRCGNEACPSRGPDGSRNARLLAKISSTGTGVVQVRCPHCSGDTLRALDDRSRR